MNAIPVEIDRGKAIMHALAALATLTETKIVCKPTAVAVYRPPILANL